MHTSYGDSERFEAYVQQVYQILLNIDGEGIQVAHRAKLRGRCGGWYEIDVYYEFERAGVLHRVAFECKCWNRPIDRDAVIAFQGKLEEIGSIHGVMVSKAGFQRGAQEYAQSHGIDLRTLGDLPNFAQVLGMQISAVGLPSSRKRGEPFWVLMNMAGSYWAQKGPDGKAVIPLFISRLDAEAARSLISSDEWVVSGLPRNALAVLINIANHQQNANFAIVPEPPEKLQEWYYVFHTAEQMKQRFLDPVKV